MSDETEHQQYDLIQSICKQAGQPSMNPIAMAIRRLAKKFGVLLKRRDRSVPRNEGLWLGPKRGIMLGVFDDPDLELIAFFHEIGHKALEELLTSAGRTHYFTALSTEAAAWEFGLSIAAMNGYRWDYYSKEMKWARTQYRTYKNEE